MNGLGAVTTDIAELVGTKVYYNTIPTDTVDALLACFTGKALRSPMRSTVPLLDMLLHAPSQLNSIICDCGAEPNSELRFEYDVCSGANSAHPSQTDLMVLGKVSTLAVEAK